MDNHRVIFTGVDKTVENNFQNVGGNGIKIWDVDTGDIRKYKEGRLNCYANGLITVSRAVIDRTPSKIRFIYSHGKLGSEKETDGESPDCYQRRTEFVRQYIASHPEDLIELLMPEHGFFVRAKRDFYPGGTRTKNVYYSDKFVLHAPGKTPLEIPAAGLKVWGTPNYFPFVKTYLLNIEGHTYSGNYILTDVGKLTAQQPPVSYPSKSITNAFLTRRGVLWTTNDIHGDEPGMYLTRGDQIKKISSDSLRSGVVSPNGCRLLYTHMMRGRVGFLGSPGFESGEQAGFSGILKVMDLCKDINNSRSK